MTDDRMTTLPPATNAQDKLIIAQPWEDYDTVLRHAERARLNGDPSRAHTFYSRLAELNPNDARSWAGLAETAVTLDEAIMSWAYVVALTPNNWEAHAQMENCLDERIQQSGVADAAVLVALGRTLVEVGQKPAANRVLARATELDPTNVEAWLWRAGVTDDQADAIACLKQVLARDPENAQAKAGLRWAQAKDPAASPPASNDQVRAAEEFFEAGQQALRENNMPKAHDLFKRAAEQDPRNESAWFWCGSTTQDVDEAINCMDRALAINPQNQAAKDTKWWLGVKKYRELFNARLVAQPVIRPVIEPSALDQPTQPPMGRHVWFILLFFLALLILLGIFVWLRLGI